jgi:hypothetical protein
MLLFLALLVVAALAAIAGGGGKEGVKEAAKNGIDRSGNDTVNLGSGNEVLSRNQLNLWSDVTNEYYDCVGYGSCIVTTDNRVETTTTDNRTSTTVNGDRNVITYPDGAVHCQSPDNPNAYSPTYCEGGQ